MLAVLATALSAAAPAAAAPAQPPATFMWDGAALLSTRAQSQAHPGALPTVDVRAALHSLRADAAAAATAGPFSVMEKPLTPASGDKHDYMSIGAYWWPCTALCNATLFNQPGECRKWNDSDLGPKGGLAARAVPGLCQGGVAAVVML